MAVTDFSWISLEMHHTHTHRHTHAQFSFQPLAAGVIVFYFLLICLLIKYFSVLWLLLDIFQSCLEIHNVDVLSFNQFIPSGCLNYFQQMLLCIARQIPSSLGVERTCVFWYWFQISSLKPCRLVVGKELVSPPLSAVLAIEICYPGS